MLRENLGALAERDPGLVERIAWPVGSDHVGDGGSRGVLYRSGLQELLLRAPRETVDRLGGGAGDASPVLVAAIGLGELVTACLARGRRVLAWDRDPWLVRLALGREDWCAPLLLRARWRCCAMEGCSSATRRALAQRGRAAVLARHTIAARVRDMLEVAGRAA